MAQLDFQTRVTVAIWAYNVGNELPTVPNHAQRILVAKKMLENLAPNGEGLDVALPNVLFLVRAFFILSAIQEEQATDAEYTTAVDTVMALYVAVGAFQA